VINGATNELTAVISAQAGIQCRNLDSRLRGNDERNECLDALNSPDSMRRLAAKKNV
jgi:hypothetical protein